MRNSTNTEKKTSNGSPKKIAKATITATNDPKNVTAAAKEKKENENENENTNTNESSLMQRIEGARDVVQDLIGRADVVARERPYLVPAAAGALGFGVGVLVGSKLTRAIVFAVGGVMLSDTIRGAIANVSRDVLRDIGGGDDDDAKDAGELEEMSDPAAFLD